MPIRVSQSKPPRIKLLRRAARKMLRPNIQIEGMRWEINPTDADPFPSIPHGDSVDPYHVYKLDLRNGDVYRAEGRVFITRANKKDFAQLNRNPQVHRVIEQAWSYYKEHHPQVPISAIPWAKRRSLIMVKSTGSEYTILRFRLRVYGLDLE